MVRDSLDGAFSRLNMQAFLLSSSSTMPVVGEFMLPCQTPSSFQCLKEARISLDWLLYESYKLRQRGLAPDAARADAQMEEVATHRQQIQFELSYWLEVYESSMATLQPQLSARDLLGFQLLRVYHKMAEIIADCALDGQNETVFDACTSDFAFIISSINDILSSADPISRHDAAAGLCSPTFSYTVDMGIIPPLYFTALKCRAIEIRQQAIRLLESACYQEGLWNGPLMAIAAREVMRIEENEATSSRTPLPSDILNSHRLYDVFSDLPDSPSGKLKLEYKQRGVDGSVKQYSRCYDSLTDVWIE